MCLSEGAIEDLPLLENRTCNVLLVSLGFDSEIRHLLHIHGALYMLIEFECLER